MRMLILKNMMGVSIVSLAVSTGVSVVSLAFSAAAISKMKEQSSEIPSPIVMVKTEDRTPNVQNRLLKLLEAREKHTLPDENSNFPKVLPEITTCKMTKQGSKDLRSHVIMTKDRTENVQNKLMRLVHATEEYNPPDGNLNFPQSLSESEMSDELNLLAEDDMSIPNPQVDEVDSHINETSDHGVSSTHVRMNAVVIKPDLVAASDEDSKPTPQDPYDPTNEGTSKGGRHKGQHLHQQRTGAHLIPIIKMGESSEGSSGLTVVKAWGS